MQAKATKKLWKDFPWLWAIRKKWYWDWNDYEVKVKIIDFEFVEFLAKTPNPDIELWVKTSLDIGEEIYKMEPLRNNSTYLQQIFEWGSKGIDYLITASWAFNQTIIIYRAPKGKNINQIIKDLKEGKTWWR
ncbi:MAG: hypothetical protein NTX00_02620 [Candidatus Parcubacteria bacterium]|nr:hypothetical protein [Candidatus Parcubacteria bacterium]